MKLETIDPPAPIVPQSYGISSSNPSTSDADAAGSLLVNHPPTIQSASVKCEKEYFDFPTLPEIMSPQFLLDIVQETSARLDQSNAENGIPGIVRRMRREYEISSQMDPGSGLL